MPWTRWDRRLAVMSGIATLTVLALWVTSSWRPKVFGIHWIAGLGPGAMFFGYDVPARSFYGLEEALHWLDPNIRTTEWHSAVFAVNSKPEFGMMAWLSLTSNSAGWLAIIPIYFLILPGAVPIVCAYWREHRRRCLGQLGHCTKCGYDLRASPERCPECGTSAPARFSAWSTHGGGNDAHE